MNQNKIISLAESFIMLISIFAFAFIIGGMAIGISPIVSAAETNSVPSGCCMETKEGGICQNMNLFDKNTCKSGLVPTECNLVEQCQVGCCYDSSEGTCSLNAPKEKCISNGGNWSNNAKCDIQQCALGCCILADQSSITTARECTKISRELNFQKNFQALDSDGTCNSKTDLDAKGACLTPTGDFSGENDCKFTTKSNCKSGDFKEGFLCTAKEFKTTCFPAKNTTCVEGKDEVYYTDTCGNIANIYDASKFNDANYWTNIVSPSESCSSASASCGNCDYLSGSVCNQYRPGKDTKPTFGNNVCRDLNCANGKKHGESWCISDYENTDTFGVAPVGSRWFKGICINGEISIEPCADYNQEVCIQNTGTGDAGASFTEAKCRVNGWRNCIAANDKETYEGVKSECESYPDDCVMFMDIESNSKFAGLPGFKADVLNTEQGNVGDIGKDMNKIIPWCVPKNTPGMVFWSTPKSYSNTSSSSSTSENSIGSGGSLTETALICSFGSFKCVSHTQKKPANTGSWKDEENPECNFNAYDQSKQKVELLMQGLNERSKMLGPCGIQVNIAGQLGKNSANSSVSRTFISKDGETYKTGGTETGTGISVEGYVLSEDYLGELKNIAGIKKMGSITKLASAMFLGLITGNAIIENLPFDPGTGTIPIGGANPSNPIFVTPHVNPTPALEGGTLTPSGGFSMPTIPGLVPLIQVAGAAMAGYQIGMTIGKATGMSPGRTEALAYALGAGAGLATAAVVSGLMTGTVDAATGATAFGYTTLGSSASAAAAGEGLAEFSWCWICVVVIIIIIILTWALTGEDNEYYIMSYNPGLWQAPAKGNCNSCNEDIRACSEYRCKSLGQNCQYYNSNGEPGWCATMNDIWSATISPWPEALSEGNKYADVTTNHFSIEGLSNDGKVAAWTGLQFGIITDKPAQCKIDNKHTKSIDEMSTDFIIDTLACETGSCSASEGTLHKIALSQHLGANNSGESTLGLVEGENNYYIRCQNFAGQSNEAEFAVKIIVDEGPDYSPPIINSFVPISENYLKVGENSSSILVYVNEPSECRYSQNVNNVYEEMKGKLTCLTNPTSAILGNWPCYAILENLTAGENKFYFQCQDQPNLLNNSVERRNINRNSKEYSINVCSTGLSITSVSPKEKIVLGKSPINLDVTVETSGCIDGGKAVCYFKGFGNANYISFFNTDAKSHSQTFTDLPAGDNNLLIECEDDAGNTASDSIRVNVELDNDAPIVLRNYVLERKVNIITNEIAECKYTTNSSIGCAFSYEDKDLIKMETSKTSANLHGANWEINKDYYIKCMDIFGNENIQDCAIRLRTY